MAAQIEHRVTQDTHFNVVAFDKTVVSNGVKRVSLCHFASQHAESTCLVEALKCLEELRKLPDNTDGKCM